MQRGDAPEEDVNCKERERRHQQQHGRSFELLGLNGTGFSFFSFSFRWTVMLDTPRSVCFCNTMSILLQSGIPTPPTLLYYSTVFLERSCSSGGVWWGKVNSSSSLGPLVPPFLMLNFNFTTSILFQHPLTGTLGTTVVNHIYPYYILFPTAS